MNDICFDAAPPATLSLHSLVSELVQSLMPLTLRNHNLILNDIPQDIRVAADENMLAFVLWNLLNGAIQSTRNECIHIEALKAADRLTVRIKDVGVYFCHAISREYRRVQDVVEKLGGTIQIASGIQPVSNQMVRLTLLLAR